MLKLKEKFGTVGIVLSVIVLYFVTFCMYLNRYLENNTKINEQIKQLLKDMSVSPNRETQMILMLSVICGILFFLAAVALYKIIFRIAKVNVDEKKLLLAIALAYILDFFLCYTALNYFSNMLLIVLIGNIAETVVVFFLCFEKINTNLFKAIVLRALLVAGNCLCLLQ